MKTGWKRLFIALNVIIAPIVGGNVGTNLFEFALSAFAFTAAYWAFIGLTFWVINGFKNGSSTPKPPTQT